MKVVIQDYILYLSKKKELKKVLEYLKNQLKDSIL